MRLLCNSSGRFRYGNLRLFSGQFQQRKKFNLLSKFIQKIKNNLHLNLTLKSNFAYKMTLNAITTETTIMIMS